MNPTATCRHNLQAWQCLICVPVPTRDCFPCSEHDRPDRTDVAMTALGLWDTWQKAVDALDGSNRRNHDEQTALDALVDFVEANGLNHSKFDPRPNTTEIAVRYCDTYDHETGRCTHGKVGFSQ